MTVYVDDYRRQATVGTLTRRWSHLVVEPGGDLGELHAFARRVGLKRAWFQGPPEHRYPHYDVTEDVRVRALRAGAQAITARQLGHMLNDAREAAQAAAAPAAAPEPEAEAAPAPDLVPGLARDGAQQVCSFGFGKCDRTDTRPYPAGRRCPDHAPWLLAGRPDPGSGRYCLAICYCGQCPNRRTIVHPNRPNVIDFRAAASGKRRVGLTEYREAQAQTRPKRQERPA